LLLMDYLVLDFSNCFKFLRDLVINYSTKITFVRVFMIINPFMTIFIVIVIWL
jgi:hypothetical protein